MQKIGQIGLPEYKIDENSFETLTDKHFTIFQKAYRVPFTLSGNN